MRDLRACGCADGIGAARTPGRKATQEKKFKKILTEEQFSKWSAMQHRKDFGEPEFN